MRVNLGEAFAYLFQGEANKITVTFIKLYNGQLEMFYKEDGNLFPIFKKSARYADGWHYCSKCQCVYQNMMMSRTRYGGGGIRLPT
jgi:hypothetical protein